MEASRPPQPPHLRRVAKGPKPCPSCSEPARKEERLVRCPRCRAQHHLECVWEDSRCACGYDLEDEARRLAVVWVERSARWVLQLPSRWVERTREGLWVQRRMYGSLLVSSVLLTAVALCVLWVFFPSVHLA